jgi:hypothetical protein
MQMLIIFAVSSNRSIMEKETRKLKAKLKKDLNFYLDNYKEVSVRSEKIKAEFDREIEQIIEVLKQLGK